MLKIWCEYSKLLYYWNEISSIPHCDNIPVLHFKSKSTIDTNQNLIHWHIVFLFSIFTGIAVYFSEFLFPCMCLWCEWWDGVLVEENAKLCLLSEKVVLFQLLQTKVYCDVSYCSFVTYKRINICIQSEFWCLMD